ncbi:MAG: hypothetical protein HGJ94_21800 [Desulfosarcina sp.]|nr:hypothetical protein [Desulfosarcina sp.]MBC2742610.1 hypothetical protein [Desulfosarcina sp.]MBC2765520.1 hypothetical protein [Desulfosarcina sp.]
MKGHGEKLSRNQERVIVALLNHTSVAKASGAAGIGEVTIYRWLKDDGFNSAYRDARRQVVQQGIVQIQKSIAAAVTTLTGIMEDQEAPASSRVSAAKTILEIGIKATEFEALEEKVDELEKMIKT